MFNKSKRPNSNSRSKSKGSKHHNREHSTQNNSHHQKVSNTLSANEFKAKLKTENSASRNRPQIGGSRPKPKSKHIKMIQKNNSNSKNETDRRLNSSSKNHCTQPHNDQDIELKIQEIKLNLQKIQKPKPEVTQIKIYFKQIEKTLRSLTGPLQQFLLFIHKLYLNPLNNIFQLILPFEALIIRREQLTQQIQHQTLENQKLYKQKNVQKQNLEVQKLRQLIENQAKLIEQKKDIPYRFEKLKQYLKELEKNKKKEFKIDLESVNKNKQILSYHDEFYDHINEFSESWRNQALKQKRF